jgi:hypothetical protein
MLCDVCLQIVCRIHNGNGIDLARRVDWSTIIARNPAVYVCDSIGRVETCRVLKRSSVG